MIETQVRKITSVLEPIDRLRLFAAVETCHRIMSEATHLLKAYYLYKFETASHPDDLMRFVILFVDS